MMTFTARRHAPVALVVVLALALALAAGDQAGASHETVQARDDFFLPAELTLEVGDTVTWVNQGERSHTVTSSGDPTTEGDEGQGFDTTLKPGESFTLTITEPTTVPYFCRFHGAQDGSGMAGTFTAQEQARRPTSRLAGESRIDTAVEISRQAFPGGASRVFLAQAGGFADALAGSSLTSQGPILLVPSCGEVPEAVLHEIDRLNPERIVALGGEAAVCNAVLDQAARAS